MNLLICTQAVDRNDSVLGFFVRWIEEFAKNCEQVTVICLREGEHRLPANVRVLSLGKERGGGRLRYAWRFWRYAFSQRTRYDAVFVHMNPEYVILGGVLWRWWGKRIGLWYLHRSVTLKLRLATLLAHHIFTGTPESFRLPTRKINVMGQGIDVSAFGAVSRTPPVVPKALFVGRLSPIKGVETLIEAVRILRDRGVVLEADVIGGADESQRAYKAQLTSLVAEYQLESQVRFLGPIANAELPPHLARATVFVNTSRTGSLDKAGIEPMAAGVPVASSNESFAAMLKPHGLYFPPGDAGALAGILEHLLARPEEAMRIGQELQREAKAHHSLSSLVPRILAILQR